MSSVVSGGTSSGIGESLFDNCFQILYSLPQLYLCKCVLLDIIYRSLKLNKHICYARAWLL